MQRTWVRVGARVGAGAGAGAGVRARARVRVRFRHRVDGDLGEEVRELRVHLGEG